MKTYFGLGYDVHRIKKGQFLFLGGVKIKCGFSLDGHSDADVLIHALMDALLGAAGLCDIGHLFPNTDPKLKGISSVKLLERVVREISKKRFSINNVDLTVIAEKPKISPFADEMKNILSKTLKIPASRIAVKATTNEKIGFIGRGEGIAAIGVATLNKSKK